MAETAVLELRPAGAANRVYFPALDGLRAVALGMVFIAHYSVVGFFGVGVNVFFVLSGFLITGILWDTRETPHRARNFYVRRTLRIFPLYYGMFGVLLLLDPVFRWEWTKVWLLWPLYLGNLLPFLPLHLPPQASLQTSYGWLVGRYGARLNLGHFWSLCVEEQFYLVWPWVVFALPRRVLLFLCGAVVVVLPIVRVVLARWVLSPEMFERDILFRTLPFQMDALLLGALLALWMRGAWRDALLRWAGWISGAAAVFVVVYVYCCLDLGIPGLRQPFLQGHGPMTWELSVVNVLSAMLLLGTLRAGTVVYGLCHLRPMRAVGRISYGGYVFHDLLHWQYGRLAAMFAVRHQGGLAAAFALVCTMLMACTSYRLFETPFLRLKERWMA